MFFERWESAGLFLPVLCARGWEKKTGKKSAAPRWEKTSAWSVGKNHWSVGERWTGGMQKTQRSVPILKKITRKPLDYS